MFRKSRLKEAILVIAIASLASALLTHQDLRNSSKHPTDDSTLVITTEHGSPKHSASTPTEVTAFSSLEERLRLENPPPLMLESLQVLLSPPMQAHYQVQAVETRVRWETEGPKYVPELLKILHNESPETRVLAAMLLGCLRSPDVIPYLENRLEVEQSELVSCALLAGLADCGETPREHGESLLNKYLTLRARTGPETDVDGWRLALMIGSIQGPELTEILETVRDNTDGGLGPMVQGSIEIRALYRNRLK